MALYETEAVVIGTKNWGEADKMLTLFTRERGLVRAAAFGARRPRSHLAGVTQMFSYIEAQLTEGRRVDTLKHGLLKEHYRGITEDLAAMAYGSFVAEVLREFLPEGEREEDIFSILLAALDSFGARSPRLMALTAVLKIMEHTGLQLQYGRCVRCGKVIEGDAFFSGFEGGALCASCGGEMNAAPFYAKERETIELLLDFDFKSKEPLRLNGKALMQAEALVLVSLQELLGRPFKSLDFIRQLAQ